MGKLKTWFQNLKIWQKLTVVITLSSLLVPPLAYQPIVSEGEAVAFALTEERGLEYIETIKDLLEHLPEHAALEEAVLVDCGIVSWSLAP